MLSRAPRSRWLDVIAPVALTGLVGLVVIAAASPTMSLGRASPGDNQHGQVACSGGATTISPCGTSADTLEASATGQRMFSVQNNSTTSHTYTPSCSVTTPLTSCSVAPSVLVVP